MSHNVVNITTPTVHLAPPSGLTDKQAQVWRETVEARTADYFGQDVVPMLEEYCRVVVMCRVLSLRVDAAIASDAGSDTAGALKALLDMRDKESRRMASLATKLRLTNQSRYTPKAAGTSARKGGGGKVWQFGQKTGA
jgi:hypothetical protein